MLLSILVTMIMLKLIICFGDYERSGSKAGNKNLIFSVFTQTLTREGFNINVKIVCTSPSCITEMACCTTELTLDGKLHS